MKQFITASLVPPRETAGHSKFTKLFLSTIAVFITSPVPDTPMAEDIPLSIKFEK